MIFVTLGTQDKPFTRLVDAVEQAVESGDIDQPVVAQLGYTPYQSDRIKLVDYLTEEQFDRCIDECELLITHAGAGSMMTAIERGKKVIACPRLAKYGEHNNDHQIDLANHLAQEGYLLVLNDGDRLDTLLQRAKTFQPRPFTSNTNHFVSAIKGEIERLLRA